MRSIRPLVLLFLLAALVAPLSTALAQEPATVALQPVAFVPLEGETFTTDVTIENAKDLLGFQFDLNFDPAAFAVEFDRAGSLPEQHRSQSPAAGARPALG
ncbi:MAG: cohesin domain-containing protein [Anaerolineae bacterium]